MSKFQSRADLLAHLKQQVGFLNTSCRLFDEGQKTEAKRLASCVRTFAHETRNSKSLLKLLGKNHIQFRCSGQPYDARQQATNSMPYYGVVSLELTATVAGSMEGKFIQRTDPGSVERWVKFSEWWTEPVLALPRGVAIYTRSDIVLYLANKDGGAHVDPEISAKFVDLYDIARQNIHSWKIVNNGAESQLPEGPDFVTARVIAGEFVSSLEHSRWETWT